MSKMSIGPAFVLSFCVGAGAAAQVAGEESENQSQLPVVAPDLSPLTLEADIDVSGQYVDNVFYTPSDRRGDFVTVVSPSLGLTLDAETVDASIGLTAALGFFAENESEDYEDVTIRTSGEFKLTPSFFLFGGADYAWLHEDRSSPEDEDGTEPVEYREAGAYIGAGLRRGDYRARFGVTVQDLDFSDTPATGGPINNDDRDRLKTEIGGRIGYQLDDTTQLFIQGVYDRRDYDDALDDFGAQRDSDGVQAAVGVAGRIGPFRGEAHIGILSHTFENPAFNTVNAIDFGADLNWRLDPRTRFAVTLDREISETTTVGASSYVSTTAGASISRRFAADLSGRGFLSLTQNDYREIDRTDYLAAVGLSFRRYLSPQAYVGAGYSYSLRQSNVPGDDFDRHAIFLSLGADLQPAYDADAPRAAFGPGGIYAGAQVGFGNLFTRQDGVRSGGRSAFTADFGDDGVSGGVFAGYRTELSDLTVGLEIEGELSDADWSHSGGRVFGVQKENSIGVSAIAGVRVLNDSLLYGRFGAVSAEFDTNYSRGGESSRRSSRETGLRIGVGTEFPIGGGLSGRAEYLVTAYDDYDLGPGAGAAQDNFSNLETLARIGLVYEFGAGDRDEEVQPVDFDGFYVGAQIGHEALISDNTGPRPDAAAPTFTLDATRAAKGGTAGVFAGYGKTFGAAYLGVEGEAEISTTDWDIDNDPTGRLYSLEKNLTVGASVRAGYVVNDAVLIYGRVGVVGSDFDTDYDFRGASVRDSRFSAGLRFGGGVEVPLSEKSRVRLDFTRTEYSTTEIDYGAGTDSIDRSENLFRLGFSYKF